MDMLALGREAFEVLWKRKTLWFFGIFAGIGGLNSNGSNTPAQHLGNHVSSPTPLWVVPLIAVGACVLVAVVLLHVLSESALIEGVTRGRANADLSIKEGLRDGRPFFWRILGLKLLFWSCAGVVAVVVVAPLGLSFQQVVPLWLGGTLTALLVLAGAPTLLTLFYVYEFALRFVVLDGDALRTAVSHAYGFLHGRLGNATRLVVVSLAGSSLCATVTAAAVLPVAGVVTALFFSGLQQPAIALGVCLAAPAAAIGLGLIGSFFSATWTLGFLDERARMA